MSSRWASSTASRALRARGVGESVDGVADGFEDVLKPFVFGGETVDEGLGRGSEGQPRSLADSRGAQGVEGDSDVDALLEQRAGCGREQSDSGRGHGRQGHQHAAEGALGGDAPRASGDGDGVGEAVDAIGGQDDVGRFG
ncbi:hypothetical protein LMU33_24955 [Streptomyces sp. JA03]|nr:hypothetical protein [Streptomyces barringtoniae]MCC5478332.1 hypothetical protein [Streptomyces barringtoniae]